MPKVSVIIPIYGVEKYIERCARSLFEQTLDDMEFIFVDDCTIDNSISILETVLRDYPNRISQTRILHHEKNMGLPYARQTGIKVASGDFIAHCDSDDWVARDMYSDMYKKALCDIADVVVCDYYNAYSNGNNIISLPHSEYTKDEYIIKMMSMQSSWAVWNKLVNRKLYDNAILYPKHSMAEDMVLSIQLIIKANRISFVKIPHYYYAIVPNSIVRQNDPMMLIKKMSQQRENLKLLEQFIKTNAPQYSKQILNIKLGMKNNINPLVRIPIYKKYWLSVFPELNIQVYRLKNVSLKVKIGFYFRLLYCFLLK